MKMYLLAVAMTAAMTGAARAEKPRVLVIPFNTLNVPEAQQWIGKGVQETLVADMGRSGDLMPVAFTGGVIVEDNTTAARLARQAQATLAIRGTAQAAGGDVRLTAQLLDARNGEILRTASVTGPVSDMLKLEDELTAQLRSPAQPPAPAAASTATATPSVRAPQVIVVAQPSPPIYYPFPPYPPGYGYGYNYGGYYSGWAPVLYGVGGGGSGVVIQHTHTGPSQNGLLPIPTGDWLPVPTNNVLPVPTNNVLPVPKSGTALIPTSSALPVPRSGASATPANNVQPLPTVSTATPRTNAGQNR